MPAPGPDAALPLDAARYRIERLIGRGGTGAVYAVRDRQLDRTFAMKVIGTEAVRGPAARQRFERAAQATMRLQHPRIVSVLDYGWTADGRPFLVMELVRGEDLRQVLVREGRIDTGQAAHIVSRTSEAVEAAHREGVLHGDLKPENIVLTGTEPDVRVLDFGIDQMLGGHTAPPAASSDDVPNRPLLVGTPAYMAPERLRGGMPDGRSDVFSLGVIAYELLTGRLPFGRATPAEILLAQERGLSRESRAELGTLARAVEAALDPDPDRRPPSPQAFAHLVNASGTAWT